jgi:hypothetical protein
MRSHGLPSKLVPCLVCRKPYRRSPGRGNRHYCSRRCYKIFCRFCAVALRDEVLRSQILGHDSSALDLAA